MTRLLTTERLTVGILFLALKPLFGESCAILFVVGYRENGSNPPREALECCSCKTTARGVYCGTGAFPEKAFRGKKEEEKPTCTILTRRQKQQGRRNC